MGQPPVEWPFRSREIQIVEWKVSRIDKCDSDLERHFVELSWTSKLGLLIKTIGSFGCRPRIVWPPHPRFVRVYHPVMHPENE